MKWADVKRAYENERYEKAYYDGDAAGALLYTDKATGERVAWDPLVHRFDLPDDHDGLLVPLSSEPS
jgi:hypothetical protein